MNGCHLVAFLVHLACWKRARPDKIPLPSAFLPQVLADNPDVPTHVLLLQNSVDLAAEEAGAAAAASQAAADSQSSATAGGLSWDEHLSSLCVINTPKLCKRLHPNPCGIARGARAIPQQLCRDYTVRHVSWLKMLGLAVRRCCCWGGRREAQPQPAAHQLMVRSDQSQRVRW